MNKTTALLLLAGASLLAIASARRAAPSSNTGATSAPVTNANWELWAQQGLSSILGGLVRAAAATPAGSAQSVNNSGYDSTGVPSVYNVVSGRRPGELGLDAAAVAAFEGVDPATLAVLDARDAWAQRPPVPSQSPRVTLSAADWFAGVYGVG